MNRPSVTHVVLLDGTFASLMEGRHSNIGQIYRLLTAAPLAVTLTGPFRVTLCGVVVPESPPLKPLNTYGALAAALTETTLPALYQALAGPMLPPAAGFAAGQTTACDPTQRLPFTLNSDCPFLPYKRTVT